MTSGTAPRGVVFDWGGTLVPYHAVDHRESWVAFARGYGAMACALNDLTAAGLRAEDAAWQRTRSEGVAATYDDVLATMGLDPADAATQSGIAAQREFWSPHTITAPHVPYVLEDLRAVDLRLGLLSNTLWPAAWHDEYLERDGIAELLDARVYSSQLDVAKPHPGAFHAAADALGLAPEACVYVGDRLYEDVFGAQRAGMRAVLVDHGRIPEDQQVAVDATPDAVITDLSSLPALLRAWTDA